MNVHTPLFNLPLGQWVDLDGKLLRFVRRGRDAERRMIFEGMDDVPRDMTDRELLEFQHGAERRLRLLTTSEASDRLSDAGRPRITFTSGEPDASDAARRRLDYVRAWERAGCPPRTEAGVGPLVEATFHVRREGGEQPVEIKPPSARQVLRWISDWVGSGGEIEALVPQKANRGNQTDRLHPKSRELLEHVVEDRYLLDTRPSAVSVYAHVIRVFEEHNIALPVPDRLPVPSLQTVYRSVARIDRYTLDCTRAGRRHADHKWRPVMSAPQTTRHNEVWEIDHTEVDAIVIDDRTKLPIGRPWVTAAIDRHTRMITGFHIGFDSPGTYSTMECMRVAILPKGDLVRGCDGIVSPWPCMGTPETLVPDQGKEFKAKSFIEACLTLGMHLQYAPVLKAWYKGKIERFFRTQTTDVFQRLPGTTFSNIFERNREKVPERVAVVTLDELRLHTLRFIVDIYHRRRHRGLGVSPLEAWDASVTRHGMRPLPDPERVTTALSHVKYRTLQRYGIEFEGLLYNSADVAAYRIRTGVPRSVRIAVDPLDLTRIRFLDPADNRFVEVPIVEAMRARLQGITLEKHKLARALQHANPNAFDGEKGLARAYVVIDDAMRKHGAKTGIANRRDAARYWEKLTRARPPEEPPAFDTAASAQNVTDGLFGEHREPDPPTPVQPVVAEPDGPDAPPSTVTPTRRRRKRPQAPMADGSSSGADRVAPNPDDDDDLDALARARGMSVRRTSVGDGR